MKIRLKKLDAGVVLSFVRDGREGAVQRTGHAGFFAAHDLMHYAVETTLGFRRGFMGLMAEGWSFDAFTNHDDPRYRTLPREAILVERLVDIFTRAYRDQAWRDDSLLPIWLDDVRAEIEQAWNQDPTPGSNAPADTATPSPPAPSQIVELCRRYSELM